MPGVPARRSRALSTARLLCEVTRIRSSGLARETALDGLDDHRRLAGARRALDEDRLSGAQPAQQSDRAVLRLVGSHPAREPGRLGVRFVLGSDDRLGADQELREQPDAEVFGGDGREHRALRLIERLVERRGDVSLAPGVLEGPRHDLDDVPLVIDARHPSDEVGLVVGLDEHRGVGGQVDGLAGRDLELDLADLRGLAVRVGELAPARRASLLALRTPERAAGAAAPELAGAVESGPLRLRSLLLCALEAVDELQRRVELLRARRVLRRDPPVEQAEGVADDAVRLGDDRLARGDRQELCALRLASGRPDRDDAKAEMLAGTVRARPAATHCRTRSGRSRRNCGGSSSPNETDTCPTSPMRSAKTVRGSAPGCEPFAHASRTTMASLPSGTIRCRRSSARSGAISGLSTSDAAVALSTGANEWTSGRLRAVLFARGATIQSTSTAGTPEGSRLQTTIPDPSAAQRQPCEGLSPLRSLHGRQPHARR